MNILSRIKKLIKRIDEVDKRSKYMSKEKCYSSNPFAFTQNKTYVWVERVKDFNKCGLFERNQKQERFRKDDR